MWGLGRGSSAGSNFQGPVLCRPCAGETSAGARPGFCPLFGVFSLGLGRFLSQVSGSTGPVSPDMAVAFNFALSTWGKIKGYCRCARLAHFQISAAEMTLTKITEKMPKKAGPPRGSWTLVSAARARNGIAPQKTHPVPDPLPSPHTTGTPFFSAAQP